MNREQWRIAEVAALHAEIERLNGEVKALHETIGEIDRQHDAEVERLRAALEQIEEETERTCQQCRLIENIARAAREPKP